MILIEPRQMDRWTCLKRILGKFISRSDKETCEILHKDISATERAEVYSINPSRYSNIDKPNIVAKVEDVQDSTSAAAKVSAKERYNFRILVIDTVPKTWKSRASRLLNHINLNSHIRWSEK